MSKKLIYSIFLALVLCLTGSVSASLPEEWSSRDIGSPSAAGSANYNEGIWTVSGDGDDIWGSSDAFHFAYTQLSGDGMIVARVLDNGSGSDTWAKGGVMIRETLNPNSKFAMMIITGGAGAGKAFQCRPNTGSYSYSSHGGSQVSPPMWVKLVRQGNLFTGYYSVDGIDWQQQPDGTGWDATPNPIEIGMDQDVYTGLCVTSVVPGEVRTFTFDSIATEMPSIVSAADPNLVAWYRFDGNALDSSDNEFHGKEIGNPTYEAGVFGRAIRLDGNGDYIDCGLAPEFDITDYITFTYWIKVAVFDKGWNTVLSKGGDWGSARAAYNDFMEATVPGTTGDYTYGVTPVNDGQWHHVGFVYDGKSNCLYVDGELDASEPSTGQIRVNSRPLWIGENPQYPGCCWNGLIDDVQIYNRALTETEILAVMEGHVGGLGQNASQPDPADGSIYEDTSVSLSWVAGIYAVSHDVYFGDNFDYVNNGVRRTFQGNQTETVFTVGLPGGPYPDGLVPGTTYYWRVDEVGADGITIYKGDVWRFSIPSETAHTPTHFEITYYDNYNYDTGRWDGWQSAETPRDAWDDKYLADESSGKTVFTDHAFTSIDVFDLKGNLFSKDGHESWGEDWNPLKSIGDTVSMQSPHHVFAALFKGMVYLEEGDVLTVVSDDDVYVFLDENTRWGQEVLSIPNISFFLTDSMTVSASLAGYHMMTVKFIERLNTFSGIEITLNGIPIRSVELPGIEDFETGDFSKYSWMHDSNWIISQREKYSGDYSAEAGTIGDNESTTLEITLDCVPGNITFYRKVSSEANFDYLKFYIDGEKKEAWSGEEDWARISFHIEEGTRTFKWTYSKDDSDSEGDDTAWIDDIIFPVKSSRSEPPDSLEGFDLYRDSIAPNIIESSMIGSGFLNFYYARNTASGNYCIHWGGVDQYGNISFRFLPIKDLSVLVDEGFAVDFWVRCDEPSAKIDIGFVDTKTGDRTDHPWRMRYMIDQNVARWDGQWNHLQIPLNTFYEQGSWDNDRWYSPIGAFDWTATEYFEIIAEYGDLIGIDFYFDEISIAECF